MQHVRFSFACATLFALAATAVQAQSGSRGGYSDGGYSGGAPASGSRGYAPAPAYSGGYTQPAYAAPYSSGGYSAPYYATSGYSGSYYGGHCSGGACHAAPSGAACYGNGHYGGPACGGYGGSYAPAACGASHDPGYGAGAQAQYAPASNSGHSCGAGATTGYYGSPTSGGFSFDPTYTPSGVVPRSSEYPSTPVQSTQPNPPTYYAPPIPLPGEPTASATPSRSQMTKPVHNVAYPGHIPARLPDLGRQRAVAY